MNDDLYRSRAVDDDVEWCLSNWACVRVSGPRSVGSTTTARRRAKQHYDMSDPEDRQLMVDSADEVLCRPPYPILIDEWQCHSDVLWRVKQLVDDDHRASGRFIVAGSPYWHPSDKDHLPWALVGRAVEIEMTPMSMAEKVSGAAPKFLSRLFAAASACSDLADWGDRCASGPGHPARPSARDDAEAPGLDWFDVALDSGYPALTGKPPAEQRRGYERLLDEIFDKDLPARLDRAAFTEFLRACARHSGEPVALATLADEAGVTAKTAKSYAILAGNAALIRHTLTWPVVLREHSRKRPRLYVAEPGLWAHLAQVTPERLMRSQQMRGALLETFVAAQVRAELACCDFRYSLRHFVDPRGDVDLIVEDRQERAVLMINVTSRSYAEPDDAKSICRLRDALAASPDAGVRFALGIVLHTGDVPAPLGSPDLVGLPLRALWELR